MFRPSVERCLGTHGISRNRGVVLLPLDTQWRVELHWETGRKGRSLEEAEGGDSHYTVISLAVLISDHEPGQSRAESQWELATVDYPVIHRV